MNKLEYVVQLYVNNERTLTKVVTHVSDQQVLHDFLFFLEVTLGYTKKDIKEALENLTNE